MTCQLPAAKVAYIGLSLELYLRTSNCLDQWRNAYENWKNELAKVADIRYSKLVFTDAEAAEAAGEIAKTDAEVIVLSAVSYTPSMLIVPLIKKLGLPVVIWSTQDSAVIRDGFEPVDLSLNHTVQGIQDVTNVLFQSGIDFSIVTSHWQDEKGLQQVASELAVIRAAKAAKNIRVLALGGAFAGMGDFDYDPVELKEKWGPEAINIDGREFTDTVETIDPALLMPEREKDQQTFDIADSLTEETHLESIRRKLAVKKLLKQYNANAFTMNFTTLGYAGFGQLPFYAINCLMAEGIGYAGEGDVLRAAAMRQLIELTGVANFTEIYTVDFKKDLFFMSHMQECNIAIARKDRKVLLKQMPFWVPGSPDYTGMFFTAEPGDYTLVCITPVKGKKFRMIAFSGNVPDLPVIETYNRAYWLLHPSLPAGKLLDRYSLAGGAHHLSAIPGRHMAELTSLAKRLDFDFVSLDD
ncbi:MAG: hypothetical protein IKC82_03455 [Lentisphaeria bacterium]|nr:hypothetical protein [Lentisphaeria bacterium]